MTIQHQPITLWCGGFEAPPIFTARSERNFKSKKPHYIRIVASPFSASSAAGERQNAPVLSGEQRLTGSPRHVGTAITAVTAGMSKRSSGNSGGYCQGESNIAVQRDVLLLATPDLAVIS
jgi:hypothetical protein